jgi:hypothetical protein
LSARRKDEVVVDALGDLVITKQEAWVICAREADNGRGRFSLIWSGGRGGDERD